MMKCVASLTALFTVALVACSGGGGSSPASTPTQPTTPAPPTLGFIRATGPYDSCGAGICSGVVGNTMQLSATATFSSGPWLDVTSEAEWRSSNTTVATVNAPGLVRFRDTGDAGISATYQTKTAGLTVRLWSTSPPPAQLSISTRCFGPFLPGQH